MVCGQILIRRFNVLIKLIVCFVGLANNSANAFVNFNLREVVDLVDSKDQMYSKFGWAALEARVLRDASSLDSDSRELLVQLAVSHSTYEALRFLKALYAGNLELRGRELALAYGKFSRGLHFEIGRETFSQWAALIAEMETTQSDKTGEAISGPKETKFNFLEMANLLSSPLKTQLDPSKRQWFKEQLLSEGNASDESARAQKGLVSLALSKRSDLYDQVFPGGRRWLVSLLTGCGALKSTNPVLKLIATDCTLAVQVVAHSTKNDPIDFSALLVPSVEHLGVGSWGEDLRKYYGGKDAVDLGVPETFFGWERENEWFARNLDHFGWKEWGTHLATALNVYTPSREMGSYEPSISMNGQEAKIKRRTDSSECTLVRKEDTRSYPELSGTLIEEVLFEASCKSERDAPRVIPLRFDYDLGSRGKRSGNNFDDPPPPLRIVISVSLQPADGVNWIAVRWKNDGKDASGGIKMDNSLASKILNEVGWGGEHPDPVAFLDQIVSQAPQVESSGGPAQVVTSYRKARELRNGALEVKTIPATSGELGCSYGCVTNRPAAIDSASGFAFFTLRPRRNKPVVFSVSASPVNTEYHRLVFKEANGKYPMSFEFAQIRPDALKMPEVSTFDLMSSVPKDPADSREVEHPLFAWVESLQRNLKDGGWLVPNRERVAVTAMASLVRLGLLKQSVLLNSGDRSEIFKQRQNLLRQSIPVLAHEVFRKLSPELEKQIPLLTSKREMAKRADGAALSGLKVVDRLSETEAFSLLGRAGGSLGFPMPTFVARKDQIINALVGGSRKLGDLYRELETQVALGCEALRGLQFSMRKPFEWKLESNPEVLKLCAP